MAKQNLSGADLGEADLSGVFFGLANLSHADLELANLSHADLRATDLSDAGLSHTNLTDATYAPESKPPNPYVAGIRGLSTLNVPSGDEVGLVQLRKLLEDAGLDDASRRATYSIERTVTRERFSSPFWTFAWVLGVLRFVGLGVTTAYGLHPGYAIGWILLLGAILTPVYAKAMLHPTTTSGVVQVFPAGRLDGTAGNPAEQKEQTTKVVQANGWRDALRSASYFSLISAVNIGFEQFTPGDWIRRMQSQEYTLEAVGWVRVVAGAQSVLSVYLLAMWALTQFGRPFG